MCLRVLRDALVSQVVSRISASGGRGRSRASASEIVARCVTVPRRASSNASRSDRRDALLCLIGLQPIKTRAE